MRLLIFVDLVVSNLGKQHAELKKRLKAGFFKRQLLLNKHF